MTAYELMIKTNQYLIRGGELTDAHKANIVRKLRSNRITDGRVKTFDDYAYPRFYIPPYNNGKKLQTIIPMSPKSYIIADNAYEFEIIRLLHMFTQPNDEVSHMIKVTSDRLKNTCFGYQSCAYADCFEAGLTVLRFLSFAATHNRSWIQKQLDVYNNNFIDRRRHSGVQRYYWLILSDMPFDIAEPEIMRQKEHIIDQLNGSYLVKNGNEDVLLCVMRNTLARLPEYSYIKDRKPYVDEKTGRLKFNMEYSLLCTRFVR